MTTHYAVLELGEQATPDDIRRAYRRLVQLTHPDRTPDPAQHRRYLAVNEAYETLSDPARRAAYDRQLRQRVQPPPPRPPATAVPRQGPPPRWQRRFYRVPKPLDFSAYAQSAKAWGRWLLVLPLLIFLDYAALQHYATAAFEDIRTYRNEAGQMRSHVTTSQGEFSTATDIPLATSGFRVRTSWLFNFVEEAYLPDGTALPLDFLHTSLLSFAGLLLVLSAGTQLPQLSDKARVNVAIVAGVVGVLVVLMATVGEKGV